MNISLFNLSRDKTNIIKGIAMISIVLHNFLHVILNIGENELDFDIDRLNRLINLLKFDNTALLNGLFSFFGYYPLELFIFISGYGLAKQYNKNRDISYFKFVIPKIIKLYFLLCFGLIVFYILFFNQINIKLFIHLGLRVLLMLNNFSYEKIFSFVGPWWYFSLTIQLYILFPFLFKAIIKYHKKGFFFILLTVYILIYLLQQYMEIIRFPIFGNALGHIPEFMLGIGLALFKDIKLNKYVLLTSLLLFVLSQVSIHFFPFSFLSVTVLLLIILYPIYSVKNKNIKRCLLFLGSISSFMFLINGPLRSFTLTYTVNQNSLMLFLISIGHLLFVILISYLLSIIYKKLVLPIENKILNIIK